MAAILHIATRADWDAARAAGRYEPASLAREGFVHCSTAAQVVATADRYFRGRADLVLLVIDAARVDVRYEAAVPLDGGPARPELFPHVYGPLALDAVRGVVAFPCGADGRFALPALASDPPAQRSS
jgi:uncharacterized protein (DUF952 family)